MAPEEDEALLFLIYQHLKVNGYKKAAKVLEKHVTQLETPEETSNLQDIYTGWMKNEISHDFLRDVAFPLPGACSSHL
ncbi:hypothetical protein E3U43_002526 [Larimichthys crocea]|uniref:Uncharacterized protein n=1 Tax=Larimichthys crocea TaxID=215358 RepID=A0ACD3QRS4_LARCR|nr:hypothetical protein E3U43_002526 [Larimichthys crocea]